MPEPLLDDLSALAPAPEEAAYKKADLFQRVLAYIIDFILLVVLSMILHYALGLSSPTNWLFQVELLFYCVVLESTPWRATLGKRWLGLRVEAMDGQLSSERVMRRNLFKAVLCIFPIVMLILLRLDKHRRGPHDRWANTWVVSKNTATPS